MPQPLFSFMPTLRSKILATSTGSGAPPEPALRQRRQIALVEIGQRGDRDPHRGHAGKMRGALDLDVAHHGLDVKTLVQRDQIAAAERGEQHHRQRIDVEQRQHADHALDRIALSRAGLPQTS